MEKRYQVFLSSTYEDLKTERAEVMLALLELDCIPSGMELFPAADESAWNFIKRAIDESDYYILIIGGRYGSMSPENISWTEREFKYAESIDKPRLAFIHGAPKEIPSGKTDGHQEELEKFKVYVQKKRISKEWTTAKELGGVVSRSMVQLMKRTPAIGWIRADEVSEGSKDEILELRRKLDEAQKQIMDLKSSHPEDEDISFDADEIKSAMVTLRADVTNFNENPIGKTKTVKKAVSLEDIFLTIAPHAVSYRLETECYDAVKLRYFKEYQRQRWIDSAFDVPPRVDISEKSLGKIKILLKVKYGLIDIEFAENDRPFWTLSKKGEAYIASSAPDAIKS